MIRDTIISFKDVSKHFGKVKAVDLANFDIQRGEFFSLLGPSGCGKTTLLRMVAGFEVPTSGEILIDGQSMSVSPPHQRPVNMVFQNYAIFPHLDVRGNIAFGMRKSNLSKADLNIRIDEVLELIKLPGYGSRKADELSGGQRQRVALARALIKQPKVLLLDEPLGALDKKLREQMQIELRQLQKQLGITFLFVTHDQEEALTLSDRVAVMSEGKVLEIATPSQLYESPGTRFVADFIGTMNFFDGTIVSNAGGTITIETEALGEVKISCTEDFSTGTSVWVAIRPEKFRPHLKPPPNNANNIVGEIGPSAYLGDRSHFHVQIDSQEEPIIVAQQNLDDSLNIVSYLNQQIWLSWSDKAIVILKQN